MAGSSNGVTQVKPPDYQLPYLQGSIQNAQNLYQDGGPLYYPGNTVAPFAPQQEQAFSLTQQRALNGSPVTNTAQGYSTDVLSGKYLNSNPYLDRTFNQAATATQNQISSEFARSGRNVGAAEPIRAQQLNDLATQIYGGNYDQERMRQQQLIPYATGLANQDYTDLGQLQNVGSAVQQQSQNYINDAQARWDYNQNAPGNALDDYIRRISGNLGQTTTSSMPRNRTATAIGGAASGAAVGGALGGAIAGGEAGSVIPGWGTAIGALAGGALGYFS